MLRHAGGMRGETYIESLILLDLSLVSDRLVSGSGGGVVGERVGRVGRVIVVVSGRKWLVRALRPREMSARAGMRIERCSGCKRREGREGERKGEVGRGQRGAKGVDETRDKRWGILLWTGSFWCVPAGKNDVDMISDSGEPRRQPRGAVDSLSPVPWWSPVKDESC